MYRQTFLAAVLSSTAFAAPYAQAAAPAEVKCPITFDGRIPVGYELTDFDTYATSKIYNPDYVKGNDIKWSQIIKFPEVETSRFDADGFQALEVTLSDQSIFQKQNGFRRAGLQFLSDAADGPGNKGIKTLHWSVKQDPQRPLNLTHEYLVRLHYQRRDVIV